MNRCITEPCILCNIKNTVLIGLYVDDILIFGEKNEVSNFRKDIMKIFSVTYEENTSEFLVCDINIDRDKKEVLITQRGVINSIKRYFGNEVNKMRKYSTPGEPNSHIVSPKNDDECLRKTQNNKYQSAVGSLMYLCKHSRPYLTNNIRDLSIFMKMDNRENYETLTRTVKYVLDTEDIGIKLGTIKGNIGEFNIECFSYSDWGGNDDNRKSISGWAIYVCGSLISWGSKDQQRVETSSSMD